MSNHGKISVEAYEDAAFSITGQLHRLGIKVYGATITDRVMNPPYWTEEKEADRIEINEWIRKSGAFDAVFDYEKAVERTDGTKGLAPEYDFGDGLHLSVAGGEAVNAVIPLELF